jgi:hypothetical protein
MKNKTFNILAMPYKNNYIAICKEAGIIRGGQTLEAALDAVLSATNTLTEEVRNNPALYPSLVVGLPWRWRLLFYWTLFKMFTRLGTNASVKRFLYQTQPIQVFGTTLSPA